MSSYYHYTMMPFWIDNFYFHDRSSWSFRLKLISSKILICFSWYLLWVLLWYLLWYLLLMVLVVSFSWSSIFWTWTQIKKVVINIFIFFSCCMKYLNMYLLVLQKEWRENYMDFKRKVARCVRKSQEECL